MPPDLLPPDYDAIERELWEENARNVPVELSQGDKGLLRKIRTYASQFGYEEEAVKEKIAEDDMFAAHFAKHPNRQGFHEKKAAEWLEERLQVPVTTLNKSGAKAMYVNSDGLIAPIPANETKPSKSLDFQWEKHGYEFYAMHKFTREGGGSQDSQFKEMIEILSCFRNAKNPSRIFIVIVDGEYYTKAKMDELASRVRGMEPKSYATPIERVPCIVDSYGE